VRVAARIRISLIRILRVTPRTGISRLIVLWITPRTGIRLILVLWITPRVWIGLIGVLRIAARVRILPVIAAHFAHRAGARHIAEARLYAMEILRIFLGVLHIQGIGFAVDRFEAVAGIRVIAHPFRPATASL